jgi:PTH2 family peptidyl-tRNA hydrolase
MYKQVILFRRDLKIGKGKLAAHVAHACLGCLDSVDEKVLEKWMKEGAKKVVLKVKDEKELKTYYKKVKDEKFPHFLVKDAGLTQLKLGTITCLGIGPVEEKKIDRITRKLKLL